MITLEKLNSIAMNMIMESGDARLLVNNSLDEVSNKSYAKARDYIEQASKKIAIAHGMQTDIIQSEIRGDVIPSSLLFNHAQDTLMTVNSEINLSRKLISVFEKNKGNC